MKPNRTHIMALIIGFLLLIVISLLIYYNYDRFGGDSGSKEPTDIETPVDKQEETPTPKPKKPSEEKPKPEDTDTLGIEEQPDIPAVDSIANNADLEEPEPKDTSDQATFIHVPYTKSIFNTTIESVEALPSSKLYYQSAKGKIESLVLSNNNGEKVEYLITYDQNGNKLDNLEIGLIDAKGSRLKYAVIAQSKISTYTLNYGKDKKAQETVTEYSITNDLHIIKGKTYIKIL